uniref:Uncharacterized protein n=1 Tax=Globisporangium ultimum (strain ATCC 200006 / CBS 805.95 / DAOM BR144) TaxID=431595 RepID=K3WPL0_GLOUD
MRQTSGVSERGFRSPIPQPDLDAERRYLDSTHRTSFINHFPSNSPHRGNANALVPAGGVGGRAVERGKAASGAMGEVFRVNSEPQKDTRAQRSWLYSMDPMIVAMQNKADHANHNPESKAEPKEAKPEHYRRQSTSITTIPLHHTGVFVDD